MKLLKFTLSTILTFAAAWGLADDGGCAARMTSGKYKGQCIDTSGKRAVRVLENEKDKITVNNFRKGGKFYKAIIPLNQVARISYLIVDLNSKPVNYKSLINISHTQMRFTMNAGAYIELFPMKSSDSGAPVLTETDLIVSMNYMAPKEVPYDPVKGFDEDLYASVLQVFSTDDEVNNRFKNKKINMYEIRLNIFGEAAGEVLRHALVTSNKIQYGVPYDTWSSNCTTILFDILDAGLGLKKQKPYRFTPFMIRDTGLVPAFKQLGQRNLISTMTRVRLLNTEFGYDLFPSDSNRYFASKIGKTLKDLK